MGRWAVVVVVIGIAAGCGSGSAGTSTTRSAQAPPASSTPPASEPAAQSFPTLRAAVAALSASDPHAIDAARCSMQPGAGGGAPSLVCKGDGTQFNQLKLKTLPSAQQLDRTYQRDLELARKTAGAHLVAGSGDCLAGEVDGEGAWSVGTVHGRVACWRDPSFGQSRLEWTAATPDGGYVLARSSVDSEDPVPIQRWWEGVRAGLVVSPDA